MAPNLTISSPQKPYLWFHTFSFQEQASDNILWARRTKIAKATPYGECLEAEVPRKHSYRRFSMPCLCSSTLSCTNNAHNDAIWHCVSKKLVLLHNAHSDCTLHSWSNLLSSNYTTMGQHKREYPSGYLDILTAFSKVADAKLKLIQRLLRERWGWITNALLAPPFDVCH